jgi:hypothetical protein
MEKLFFKFSNGTPPFKITNLHSYIPPALDPKTQLIFHLFIKITNPLTYQTNNNEDFSLQNLSYNVTTAKKIKKKKKIFTLNQYYTNKKKY